MKNLTQHLTHVSTFLFLFFFTSTLFASTLSVTDEKTQNFEDEAYIQFTSLQSEQHFEQLPLSTSVEIDVNSVLARTRLTQTFHNQSSDWLEGVYYFPLPESAAVDTLKMTIGQRIIEGEIQEKQQAEATYQKAKAEGKIASLVKQTRPNLFSTKLANIAPNSKISITIEFQQLISIDGTNFSLHMPLAITPRYQPTNQDDEFTETHSEVEFSYDSSDKLPETLQTFNLAQQPQRPVDFLIRLNPGFDVASLTSDTHEIVTEQHGNQYHIRLQQTAQADKDFVLQWQPQLGQQPNVALFSESSDDYNYHLMMLLPPTHDLVQQKIQPREMIFVIDSSGSMSGSSMQQAIEGLKFALSQLNPEDRFNIIDFDHEARKLFSEAVPVSQDNIDYAMNFINTIEANGGTEIAKAIDLALTKPDSEQLRQIIFLTDGSIGNEKQIFSMIHQRLGNNRLFTIGIGSAPNSYFMKKAAEFGRGSFTYIRHAKDVEHQLNSLFTKLRYPVLGNFKLQNQTANSIDLQPQYIPDLYLGEVLFASYRVAKSDAQQLSLSGKTDNYQWNFELPKVVNGKDKGVAKMWARMKIDSLTNEMSINYDQSENLKQQVTQTALDFHLVSDYTSLVAVDKTPARIVEELKKLQLANPLPHGFQSPNTHGYPQGGTLANISLVIGFVTLFLALFYLLIGFLRTPHPCTIIKQQQAKS